MNLATSIPEPYFSHLKFIHEKITSSGNECYLVGGSVRDLYMNRHPHEYDLTTSAHPNTVKSLFKSVIETGIKHGTVTVLIDRCPYEVTTYRIDLDYTDGRRPDHVEFGKSLTEDLKRRDFTMNALALNLVTGEIIDHHQGREDIDNRIIRTIGNPLHRFSEDGLRPIRAMRFASVLNFKIESETKLAIRETRSVTAKISIERFQDEIVKSLKGKNPSTMLRLLVEETILSIFLPDFHIETISSLEDDGLELLDRYPKSNLGYLTGIWSHVLKPDIEPLLWAKWLQKLKFSNSIIKDALFILNLIYITQANTRTLSDFEIRKIFLIPIKKHIQQRNASFPEIQAALSIFSWRWLEPGFRLWAENPPLLLSDLKINGTDLENLFPTLPKKYYGELLSKLLDEVIRVPENNEFSFLHKQCAYFLSKM